MNIRQLCDWLQSFDDDRVEVEVATSEHKDEWYEIADLEATTNHRGNIVVVINTD